MPNDGAVNLSTNDVLGIIQRHLAELNSYCAMAPHAVDGNVVMAYLERAAMFAQQLPASVPTPAQPADAGEAETATRN